MTVNYRYEIDNNEGFAIRMWDLDNPNEENAPFLYQPHWPSGVNWNSYEEAENWAKAVIAQREDKTNGAPGSSPDLPIIPYDPAEDISLIKENAKAKALAAGLTEEEIRALKLLA